MTNTARDAGVIVRRIHLVVAIDRLLARLLVAAPGRWVVKGGYANQLRRPDDARFTEDLDLKIDAAIEMAPELLAYAFGEYDGYNLWAAPDNVSMAAVAIAIGGGGALSKFETTVLLTVEETLDALRRVNAVGYRQPGA